MRLVALTVVTAVISSVLSSGGLSSPAQALATCAPTETTFTGNGTIGTNGTNYTVLKFTSTGACTWTAPAGVTTIDYLVVGGGGSGGSTRLGSAGGGGGGQVQSNTSLAVPAAGTVDVTVGAGGTPIQTGTDNASNPRGTNGGSSSIAVTGGSTVTSLGGSAGANAYIYNVTQATPSTSGYTGGGGSSHAGTASTGSTGTGGASYKGGNGIADSTVAAPQAGGGGGGAGGVGANATSGQGGAGGVGLAASITGTSTYYGGGGGGGRRILDANGAAGAGGNGGGGAGGEAAVGTSGTANTGGGGGGAALSSGDVLGGSGGSGLVVLRYVTPTIPSAVQGFQVAPRYADADTTADSATLSWTPLTNQTSAVTQYEIEYSTAADFSGSTTTNVAVTNSAAATPSTATITGLTDGATYYFRIKARNAIGVSSSFATVTSSVLGAEDYALNFNGTTSGAQTSSQVIPPTGNFTAEAWFKPESVPSAWQTIMFAGTAANDRMAIYYYNNDSIQVARDSSWANITVGNITGQWNHVSVTVDRSTNQVTLYLNGVQLYQAAMGTTDFGTGSFYVGREVRPDSTLWFKGQIDQVKVWSSVLTPAQVKLSMNSWDNTGVTGATTLVAHYD